MRSVKPFFVLCAFILCSPVASADIVARAVDGESDEESTEITGAVTAGDEVVEQSEPVKAKSLGISFLVPENYKLGFEKIDGNRTFREYVPTGETVDAWSEMVTVSSDGGALDYDLQEFFVTFKSGIQKSCPEANVKFAVDKSKSESPYVGIIIDCPMAGGRPYAEMALIQGMNGKEGFFTVQKAWRFTSLPQDLQVQLKSWVDMFLKVRPCNGDSTLPGCS